MTPDQFRRVRALFEELRGLPAGEWAARLEAACPDDPAVRQEVHDLLQQAADDLAAPTQSWQSLTATTSRRVPSMSGGQPGESASAADPLLGTSIGPYRIRGVLGQGGMGSVYEAEHERTKQVVALKLIRSGLATPALLRRFEFELQVLARLEHPGIARIYHADTADIGGGPQPYFAMELVRGQNLVQYATEQKLGIRQRLELAARIADAVQYAHQQGVIHRDLKPGNIFVTSAGQPKILDFGVARATDSDVQSTTLQTDIGQLIGTLPYMSPEQAAGDPNQIDTRSDVYALGVVIYELLTGRLPYLLERRLIHEVVRIIKEEEPTRLSSLNKTLRGDVETIVGKALEKEKERRYASANALAADIRRYLNDEPIAARPPSAPYQIGKFARRNKVLVGGVAATFIALTAGLATSLVLYQRAEAEAERATTAEARERGERERAETALAEVTKSRDEMAQIADFQDRASIIDPTTAGNRLTEDVNRRYAAALEKLGVPEAERAAQADAFRQQWLRVSPTDVAESLIDETVAFSLRESALAIRRRVLSEDDLHVLTSITALGHKLLSQGELAKAEPYLREAVEKYRRVRGKERILLTVLDCMGVLLDAQGKLAEAEPYFREALETYRRVLGEEHPDTLAFIDYLGFRLEGQDKFAEAEPYFREALETRRRVLGEEHPATLLSNSIMGYLLDAQGKLVEAEPYFREELETRRRVQGEEHPDTISSIFPISSLLQDQGKHQEAVDLLASSEPAARSVFTGGNAAHLGSLLRILGEARASLPHDADRFAAAEANLTEAHAIFTQSPGKQDKNIRACMQGLVDLYDTWHKAVPEQGYDAKAAEWRTKLEAWQASTQPAASKPAPSRPTASQPAAASP